MRKQNAAAIMDAAALQAVLEQQKRGFEAAMNQAATATSLLANRLEQHGQALASARE